MQVLVATAYSENICIQIKILAIIHAVMQFDCVCNELATYVAS